MRQVPVLAGVRYLNGGLLVRCRNWESGDSELEI